MAVSDLLWRVCERLNVMRVQSEVVEIRNLGTEKMSQSKNPKKKFACRQAHLIEMLHKVRVLIGNMFLHK